MTRAFFRIFQIVSLLGPIGLLSSCITSGSVASGRDGYEDPTSVKTVENTQLDSGTNGDEASGLAREAAILKGELENSQVLSKQAEEKYLARIAELEGQNLLLSQQVQKLKTLEPPTPTATVTTGPAKSGVSLLWDSAVKAIRAERVEKAIVPLEEIVRTYPKDPQFFAALVNLGLAQYRNKDYSGSAQTFNQVIDKFAKRKEVPLAWLGQAAAFSQLQQLDDAKLLFEEIIKRYPGTLEAKFAKRVIQKKEKVPLDLFPFSKSHKAVSVF